MIKVGTKKRVKVYDPFRIGIYIYFYISLYRLRSSYLFTVRNVKYSKNAIIFESLRRRKRNRNTRKGKETRYIYTQREMKIGNSATFSRIK